MSKAAKSKTTTQVPPSKPFTAYLQYRMDVFKKVQAQNPGKKVGQLSKIIGVMWKEIDEASKKKYEDNYKMQHTKYVKEKEEYESKFGKIKRKSSKSTEKKEKPSSKSKSKPKK